MRTIVYYGQDGKAAQQRVTQLRLINGDDAAQAIAASGYVGERIKADEIEFMPDAEGWHRAKIEQDFAIQQARDAESAAEDKRRRESSVAAKLSPIQSEDDFRRSMTARATAVPQAQTAEIIPAPAEEFREIEAIHRHPLDHDGDGKLGGSLPKAKRGRPPKAKPQE